MKTLIRILIAIALTILILNQANAQTYQGSPVKYQVSKWNIHCHIQKEFTKAEAEQFFKFTDQLFSNQRHKDRYLITPSKIYHRRGVSFPFKNVVTIKSKLPNHGNRKTSAI